MSRFLSPERLLSQSQLTLDREESHHALHVLRLTVGETIQVIDGHGALAEAVIEKVCGKHVIVSIVSVNHQPRPRDIQLAFGIAKAPALEFIVKRCTEVGASSFQPLVTEHAMNRTHWNPTRWGRVATEAMKQCERLHVPELLAPVSLSEFLSQRNPAWQLVCCSERQRDQPIALTPEANTAIMVGPEGGWSLRELEQIQHAGAAFLGLGPNRLRAETAALAAIIRIQAIGERAVQRG